MKRAWTARLWVGDRPHSAQIVLPLLLAIVGCRSRGAEIAGEDARSPVVKAVSIPSAAPRLDISPNPFTHPDFMLVAEVRDLQAADATFVDVSLRDLVQLAPHVVGDSQWRTGHLLNESRPWNAGPPDSAPEQVMWAASIEPREILRHVFRSADHSLDFVLYETRITLLLRVSGPALPPRPPDERAVNALAERLLIMREPDVFSSGYSRDWHFPPVAGTSMPTFVTGLSLNDGSTSDAWIADDAVFFTCYKRTASIKGPIDGPWFDPAFRDYVERLSSLKKIGH